MWIKKSRYYCYRNIAEQELDLYPGLNILLGDNGQGKTNFIEGLILALTGDTFRFGSNEDLTFLGRKESLVRLDLEHEENGHQEVLFSIKEGRKGHKLNQKRINSLDLASRFPVILFSPESLAVIKEGGAERRDLIDDYLFLNPQLNYQTLFGDYLRLLKSRNKVLKGISDGTLSSEQGDNLLLSYEGHFINLAAEVSFHRIQGIIHILEDFKKMGAAIYPKAVDISVDYLISDNNAMTWGFSEILESLKNRLNQLRGAEKSLGSSLIGPHKHDVRFLVNSKDSRTFCSQGQQRALILAFKLAQLMYHKRAHGTVPVLFLDDVLSELDSQSRANLIGLLNETEGQIFLTTTDRYLCRDFKDESLRFIGVESGKFSYL